MHSERILEVEHDVVRRITRVALSLQVCCHLDTGDRRQTQVPLFSADVCWAAGNDTNIIGSGLCPVLYRRTRSVGRLRVNIELLPRCGVVLQLYS